MDEGISAKAESAAHWRIELMNKRLLNKILRYRNPSVVERFARTYGVQPKRAQLIFEDLLRFLWLSKRHEHLKATRPSRFKRLHHVELLTDLAVVDEMWHAFLLHSRDYREFCETYFGGPLDHEPGPMTSPLKKSKPRKASAKRATAQAATNAIDEALFEEYVGFIIDELGAPVAIRWHATYPRQYSEKKLLQMQLKASRS